MLQQYCLLESFINNNNIYCSLKFLGGLRLLTPVTQVALRGFIKLPPFLEEHVFMLWLLVLVSPVSGFSSSSVEGMKPPLNRQQGSLFWWVGVFCIRKVDRHCHSSWHGGYLPISLPPCFVWPCLLWPSSMSGCICCWVHYLPASTGIDIVPSTLHTCSFQGLQPHHVTWGLHPSSVDAPVDIHGWSHNFPFIHPREALLVGCWVTALPLFSCGVHFISPPTEVVLHGVGLAHTMRVAHAQGNANLWHDKKSVSVEDAWPSVLVHHFVRGDVCHDLDASPPKSPLPTYPWSSSFP